MPPSLPPFSRCAINSSIVSRRSMGALTRITTGWCCRSNSRDSSHLRCASRTICSREFQTSTSPPPEHPAETNVRCHGTKSDISEPSRSTTSANCSRRGIASLMTGPDQNRSDATGVESVLVCASSPNSLGRGRLDGLGNLDSICNSSAAVRSALVA